MSDETPVALTEAVAGSSPTNTEDTEKKVVKDLFRKSCPYGCCASRWSEFAYTGDEQDLLEAKVAQLPIVNRFRRDRDPDCWETSEFTINSQPMRDILGKALDKYPDLDLGVESWTFFQPFKPIVHRWDRLKALQEAAAESPDRDSVDDLLTFLTPVMAPYVDSIAEIRDTGKIDCDSVWQIFPPGELVVTTSFGEPFICRAVMYKKVSNEKKFLTVEHVDWNGQRCGLKRFKINLNFVGISRVTALPVYPLSFADDPEKLKERMVNRGRKFEQLRGYCFREYDGVEILMGGGVQKPVSGRVIIDAFAYYKSRNVEIPSLKPLNDDGTGDGDSSNDEPDKDPKIDSSDGLKDTDYDECASVASSTHTPPTHGSDLAALPKASQSDARSEDLTPLTDEQCLITMPWVVGMDLKSKEWGQFRVDKLEEIAWNDKAFDALVLPGGEKELAWEFVESKALDNQASDDFIPGKGRGFIILMFGPPGVGKTYTAEAVAERSRVPLYTVSAGILGSSPEDVETSLDYALDLCRMWNAMLLLDEADVFLGARTDEGISRNELVSIFLTKLEYYQGILFLTTNRFAHIDHAFQSRIDLFLPYHALTPEARKQVWVNFVEHVGREKFDIGPGDMDRLAGLGLNGREIKNLIKSAQLLSARSGGVVTAERLYMLADKRVQALAMLAERAG